MSAFHKSTLREYFESIVVAVILALFIRTFVVQAFKIPTGSMEQNLLIGDHLLVNKFVFSPTATDAERGLLPVTSINRGDVIVFKYPEDPERDFIKRVIGLPGDVVEVRHKRVYIDGRPLDEPYVYYLRPPSAAASPFGVADLREQYGPVTVPPSEYFVMGDNRDNSRTVGIGASYRVTWLKEELSSSIGRTKVELTNSMQPVVARSSAASGRASQTFLHTVGGKGSCIPFDEGARHRFGRSPPYNF